MSKFDNIDANMNCDTSGSDHTPESKEELKKHITAYNDGSIDWKELFVIYRSLTSPRPVDDFPGLLSECDREEAIKYMEGLTDEDEELNQPKTLQPEGDSGPGGRLLRTFPKLPVIASKRLLKLLFQKDDTQQLPEDTYSIIMVEPFSLPSLLAWFIFFTQILSYIVIFVDMEQTVETSDKNIFHAPHGVTVLVYISQGVALFYIILVQEALWATCTIFMDGFSQKLQDEGINKSLWYLGNALRFVESMMMMFVTMVLIFRQSNVVDLFKDFTVMTFISSVDDLVFALARMSFLGIYMKKATERCIEVEFTNNYFMIRSQMIIWITVALYIFWWIFCIYPQINGEYLNEDIFLQINPQHRMDLSRITGIYHRSNHTKDGRFFYRKVSNAKKSERIILRYCKSGSIWVVTDSTENECESENILIETEPVYDEDSFDPVVSLQTWYERMVVGKVIIDGSRISLVGLESETEAPYTLATKCKTIVPYPHPSELKHIVFWNNSFTELNDTMLYGRSVFYQQMGDYWNIIVYLGLNWALISSEDLSLELPIEDSLRSYLQEFDGYFSNYTVRYMSEPVSLEYTAKTEHPFELNWYVTTDGPGKSQTADMTKQIESKFYCVECAESRDCEHGGLCNEETRMCECKHGTRGVNCQILPLGDGKCDDLFNQIDYDFDGGDCCADTCVSTDEFSCGVDSLEVTSTNKVDIGYDCKKTVSVKCENCWIGTSMSDNNLYPKRSFVDEENIQLSLSSNGRVFAIGSKDKHSIHIYDRYGSSWEKRGFSVEKNVSRIGSYLKVSSPLNSVTVEKENYAPVTVAVGGESFSIYDWHREQLKWIDVTPDLLPQTALTPINIGLYNEGKSFMVAVNGFLVIFRRTASGNDGTWEKQLIPGNIHEFTMSEDGKNLFVSFQETKNFVLHYIRGLDGLFTISNVKFDLPGSISSLKTSSDSTTLAALVNVAENVGNIYVFSKQHEEDAVWLPKNIAISGVLIEQDLDSFAISSSEADLRVTTIGTNHMVVTYQWNNGAWKELDSFKGYSMTVSGDYSTLIVADPLSLGNVLTMYERFEKETCAEDEVLFRLSLTTGNVPSETSWTLYGVINSTANILEKNIIMTSQTYYHSLMTVVEQFCVPKCMGLEITQSESGFYAVYINGSLNATKQENNHSHLNNTIIYGDNYCHEIYGTLH